MISIMRLFELRAFSDKETRDNRQSNAAASENMYRKSRMTDNMVLRNSPLNAKGIRLLKRSIAHKHGATVLTKRLGNTRLSNIQSIMKKKYRSKAKQRMAA